MSKSSLPRRMLVPIGNSIHKAAELRGMTVSEWVMRTLIVTAIEDCNEAREILEKASFASRQHREQRDKYKAERARALIERLAAQRRPIATGQPTPKPANLNGDKWPVCLSCPTPTNCRSREVCTHEAKPNA